MNKLIVASDLHLGSHRNDVYHFSQYLNTQDFDNTELILLGDVIDNFKKRSLTSGDLFFIEAANKFPFLTIISGNHDEDQSRHKEFFQKSAIYTDEIYRGKIYLTHGHAWHQINEKVERLGDFFYDKLLYIGHQYFTYVKRLAKHSSKKRIIEGANLLLEVDMDIDNIIVGHLHEQFEMDLKYGKLFCCGCFVESRTFIEIKDDQIVLRKI